MPQLELLWGAFDQIAHDVEDLQFRHMALMDCQFVDVVVLDIDELKLIQIDLAQAFK